MAHELLSWRSVRTLIFLFGAIFCVAPSAFGAMAFSTCRTLPTNPALGSRPSAPPPPRSPAEPSTTFESFLEVIQRVQSGIPRFATRAPVTEADLKFASPLFSFADDLWVYYQTQVATLTGNGDCVTSNQVIVTRMMEFSEGATEEDLRIGYKICTFYQGRRRQVEIENTCRPIGDPRGYSLNEIDSRFLQIDESVRFFQTSILGTATAIAALTTFKGLRAIGGLRALAAGSASAIAARTALLSIPSLAVYTAAAHTPWLDFPIQNLVELRDAAKLLYDGQVHDVVSVSIPIEEFERVLSAYLATIPRQN